MFREKPRRAHVEQWHAPSSVRRADTYREVHGALLSYLYGLMMLSVRKGGSDSGAQLTVGSPCVLRGE
jgi:hypothetical protein